MAQAKAHVEQEAQVLVGSDNCKLVEHLVKMCQVREIYQLPKMFYSATLAYLSSQAAAELPLHKLYIRVEGKLPPDLAS